MHEMVCSSLLEKIPLESRDSLSMAYALRAAAHSGRKIINSWNWGSQLTACHEDSFLRLCLYQGVVIEGVPVDRLVAISIEVVATLIEVGCYQSWKCIPFVKLQVPGEHMN